MKILHCPTSTGGNPQGLARAERQLGLDSKAVIIQQNYFNYKTDQVLLPDKASPLKIELSRWLLFFIGIKNDVIHYNFGQPIMPFCVPAKQKSGKKYSIVIRVLYFFYTSIFELFDVRVYSLMKKPIIVTYQGSDARQMDFCRDNFDITIANEFKSDETEVASDETKRKQIAKLAGYADRIYALNPDLLHVLPKTAKYLPYAHVDLQECKPSQDTYRRSEKLVVAHAPTNRVIKGTPYLLEAVDRLHAEGIEFEFLLIEGVSNREARRQYERADILVDQLLAGWYGGLAVEVMAIGKPVIAYIREDDLQFIPKDMKNDLPIINATPENIYEVIKYCLTDGKNDLKKLGHKSRLYVEKWHDPLKIASMLKEEYESLLAEKRQR